MGRRVTAPMAGIEKQVKKAVGGAKSGGKKGKKSGGSTEKKVANKAKKILK